MSRTFSIASNDIASEEFDGEYVVLNVASGHYFSLAGGAALVWKGLVDGHSLDALFAGFSDDAPQRAEIEKLVQQFVAHGLLTPADRVAPSAAVPSLGIEGLTFEVTAFDDLADLLLADPVHDVDEQAGWPHRPGS